MQKNKHILSQNDLATQIKRMVAFIEHEANERTEEIDSKSEGEFCYEKGRLIHKARKDLNRIYEKKEKLVVKQAQIDAATMQNQARLRQLACREAHIARVEAEVQDRLLSKIQNLDLYRAVLLDMLIQGLFRMLEKRVKIRVREEDKGLVEELLDSAKERYQTRLGQTVKLCLDTTKYLPPSCLGGVELATPSRKVRVHNTFHSRLQLVVRHLVPAIRQKLFDS